MTKKVIYTPEYLAAVEKIRTRLQEGNWTEIARDLQLAGHDIEGHHLGRIARSGIIKLQKKTFDPLHKILFPGVPVPPLH